MLSSVCARVSDRGTDLYPPAVTGTARFAADTQRQARFATFKDHPVPVTRVQASSLLLISGASASAHRP